MTYKIYKMTFQSAHFGDGMLDFSNISFSADRLFSALVLEAIKQDKLDEWLVLSAQEDFVLTDAFPITGKQLFLPKAIGYPLSNQIDNTNLSLEEQRRSAKRAKKLSYLSLSDYPAFLSGQLPQEIDVATHDYVQKNQPSESGALYQVGVRHFHMSLYVIATPSQLFDQLMMSLQYSGLGGKRSSGYGRFDLEILALPSELDGRLTTQENSVVMTLTTALPVDEDLEIAMENGKYLLKKSSGFAFSESQKNLLRKQDLYKFQAGSTFSKTFKGQIVDVRPVGFEHPVWNFAKPLFFKLE